MLNPAQFAEVVAVVLNHQLENAPFLRDADGIVAMVAWCVKRIDQFGPGTELVSTLTCLFQKTSVQLSAADVGLVLNLTFRAQLPDLLRLHRSLIKWSQQTKLIRSVCK